MAGMVYIVRSEIGLHKIGIAKISMHFGRNRDGLKLPGELLFACEWNDYDDAEMLFNLDFRKYRDRGEWFDLTLEELDSVKSCCEKKRGKTVTGEFKKWLEPESAPVPAVPTVVVPDIPQALKDRTFDTFKASDIKWVKNVNDPGEWRMVNGRHIQNPAYNSAYLPPDDRVITSGNGVLFCLQMNRNLRGYRADLTKAGIGELILIHQKLDGQTTLCFTHLVTPVNNAVIDKPYPFDDCWPGIWVKVIAMTGNKVADSIPLTSTEWQNVGITGKHYDLSHRAGRIRRIDHNQELSPQKLSWLQKDIWDRFNDPGKNWKK